MAKRFGVLLIGFIVAVTSVDAAPVDYVREVKPIFREHCAACHGVLKQNGSLRIDTGHFLNTGSDSGPAVIPGKHEESLLWKVISGRGTFQMPPDGEGARLPAAKIDLIARWIDEGGNSPADERPDEDPRKFWSYQPIQRPAIPLVDGAVVRNSIDEFLVAEQLKQGLTARPEADKATLLRRVTLDLIGLPPMPDELHVFLADTSPDAYERVVDRLSASPLYGERWGRHWMDVWRYSDWYGSRGINEIRYSQRHIWRWRDWIIESLNVDRGYDRMLQEMLAGDEIAPGNADITRATGFLGRNWYKFDRNVWMFDTVEQTAQAFLATTMKCCRCHDHKFDPLVQQDYYRFRAYFEPHDVRTDPLTGDLATEKDATLGPVLKTGVALVYDKQPDVKTYVFQRGDNRYPDEKQVVQPGIPAVYGVASVPVEPVELPLEAWYPALNPKVIAGLEQEASNVIARSTAELDEKRQLVAALQQKFEQVVAAEAAGQSGHEARFGTVFTERFEQLRPEVWKAASGEWTYEPGKLLQKVPGSFVTMVADVTPPRDFIARVNYRTLDAGLIHSVGFFFDLVELRDAQAVYSATNNTTSTIQAFHRKAGLEAYPPAGVVPWPIKIGQEITVDMAARHQLLNVWVNGELAIAYSMPSPRQSGKFALWTHAGSAEFLEVLIDPLPADFRLATVASDKIRSPFVGISKADIEQSIVKASTEIPLAEAKLAIAQAEKVALAKRIVAEHEKVLRLQEGTSAATPENGPPSPNAQVAAQAERQVAMRKAEHEVMSAERNHVGVTTAIYTTDEAKDKAIRESQAKVDAAKKTVETAKNALASTDAAYSPLGSEYPLSSTGRRTALAKWITDSRHPRTSRVAVNHIWLRHFGEAIVPSVSNFGLNGMRPSHPELLDWLAAEFTDSGWSMKRLHRLIVTSAAYCRVTTDGPDEQNLAVDPKNRYLWRMNSRRMESEVVRDSVLALGGRLDLRFGGPEISETLGERSARRSLYFRSTPNEKMSFLDVFDQANPNECYRRQESVMPQQALALTNSLLSSSQAGVLSEILLNNLQQNHEPANRLNVINAAFEHVLSRLPKPEEIAACEKMLSKYVSSSETVVPATAVQALIHVLLNHNDFVTIR